MSKFGLSFVVALLPTAAADALAARISDTARKERALQSIREQRA